ncbi:hypothetical protein Cflav_PD1785 [Pedosphaera parvula Ellin514]|uniref:Uncharacterized protein n=1 Tax=Pedosphaera parvula (strain Ellin514) TaxID=320771 RepID=B9XN27_PEDPL|nr:hypothetical protein Cflav_PD1785 [Pedosphaera parvula Ellin514]
MLCGECEFEERWVLVECFDYQALAWVISREDKRLVVFLTRWNSKEIVKKKRLKVLYSPFY